MHLKKTKLLKQNSIQNCQWQWSYDHKSTKILNKINLNKSVYGNKDNEFNDVNREEINDKSW